MVVNRCDSLGSSKWGDIGCNASSWQPGWVDRLGEILPKLSLFLDAEGILLLRSTAHVFREFKYRLGGDRRTLSFSSLRGYDGQALVENILSQVLCALDPATRSEGIELDFSHCVLLKDAQLAWLTSTAPFFVPSPQPEKRALFTKLVGLKLDFCPLLTDKGINALLSAHLPHLQRLSLRCNRSEALLGEPFASNGLSQVLWPKIREVFLDFSSFTFDSLQAIATFITRVRTAVSEQPLTNPSSPSNLETSSPPSAGQKKCASSVNKLKYSATIHFAGSGASKAFLESIGVKHLIKALGTAINNGNATEVAAFLKQAHNEIEVILSQKQGEDPLIPFVFGQGSRLLSNIPVSCPTSEEGGVSVWTLPVSVAALNGDLEMVTALHEAGAELDIIDHVGKSPLVRAVANGDIKLAKYLISCGVSLAPHVVSGASALNIAISRRDREMTRLLLEKDHSLVNLKCPAVKGWKSPLHVACEIGDEVLIHFLLDWGANPSSYSGSYKNSPIMLAYRANPRFLTVFLQGGVAFRSLPLASEVLSAAIAKNDVKSIQFLVSLFPELISRPHQTWSYPHIQAAKMGKVEALETLLSAYRTYATSLSHRNAKSQSQAATAAASYLSRERLYQLLVPHAVDNLLICPKHPHGIICPHKKRRRPTIHPGLHVVPLQSAVSAPPSLTQADNASTVGGRVTGAIRPPTMGTAVSMSMDNKSCARPSLTKLLFTKPESLRVNQPAQSHPVRSRSNQTFTLWGRRSSAPGGDQVVGHLPSNTAANLDTFSKSSDICMYLDFSSSSMKQDGLSRSAFPISDDGIFVEMAELLALRDEQSGNTAMHMSSEDGRLECLNVLLTYGGDLDSLNSTGQTCLHCACNENRKEIVEFLMKHGCRLKVRDRDNVETPLMVCIRTRNDELADLIISEANKRAKAGLTEVDADSDTNDHTGQRRSRQTALGYAIFYGRYDIVKQLLQQDSEIQAFSRQPELLQSTLAIVQERLQSNPNANEQVLKACHTALERVTLTGAACSSSASSVGGTNCLATPRSGALPNTCGNSQRSSPSSTSGTNERTNAVIPGGENPSGGNDDVRMTDLRQPSFCSLCSQCDICAQSSHELCVSPQQAVKSGDCESKQSRAVRARYRAKKLQNKLKSAAKKPFNIFHRGEKSTESTM